MFCKRIFQETQGFDSVLRPILTWMRFIGLGRLQHVGNSVESKFKTAFLLCLSYGMIFGAFAVFVIGLQAEREKLMKNSTFGPFRNSSLPTPHLFSIGIQQTNLAVFSVGCHLAFLLKSGQSWENLRNTLRSIQEKFNPHQKFYSACLKCTIALDFLLFIVSINSFSRS